MQMLYFNIVFLTRLNSISFKTFFSSLTMAKEKSFWDLEGLSEAFEIFIEERTPTAQCKKWQKKFKRRVHRITRYGFFYKKMGKVSRRPSSHSSAPTPHSHWPTSESLKNILINLFRRLQFLENFRKFLIPKF